MLYICLVHVYVCGGSEKEKKDVEMMNTESTKMFFAQQSDYEATLSKEQVSLSVSNPPMHGAV